MDANDPKVIELSFKVLESIIVKCDDKNYDDIMKVAKIMCQNAQIGNYPEELKLAYTEALAKLETLNEDQIRDLREMLQSED